MIRRIAFLSTLLYVTANAIPSPTPTQQKSGCGSPLPSAVQLDQSKNLTIQSGGRERKYRIHVPPSYQTSTPVPLILSFHGRGDDAKFQEELSQFSNASYGFKGIAIYPEGVPNKKGTQQWQGDPDAPSDINDVQFTLDLIEHIEERYCIDDSRVYAAGKSNGGGFTGVLACDSGATEKIAAFAPVSGAFYLVDGKPAPCSPSKSRGKIPIMETHGEIDGTILYNGGPNTRKDGTTQSLVSWVNDWAQRDGFDINANKSSTLCEAEKKPVTRFTWDDTVIHYKYSNLKHVWPSMYGTVETKNTTCKEADATTNILDFFSKWSYKKSG